MKKILAILFLSQFQLYGQITIFDFCFDQPSNCSYYQMSDPEPTLTINPNSSWQIGAPQKSTFTAAWSSNNALITDSINSYPISDTAIFTIQTNSLQSSSSIEWFNFNLSFHYNVDSDTLTDFGLI